MKRLLSSLLILLLLTGCGTKPVSAPPAAPAEPSTQEGQAPENPAPETEPAPEVITADSLKAEYEAEGFVVREIVPYEGDFLVYYGTEPYNGMFQWVYTGIGLRAPLLFSDREILDYEIICPGHIRVLQGNTNIYNGALSFPTHQYAVTALPVWSGGQISTDLYASGSVERQTYWAPVSESHIWGWDHGEVALVDLRITVRGIEAVFGPTADNIGDFYAAASSAPVMDTDYDEASHTMTLTFHQTLLSSGDPTELYDMAAHEGHGRDCELYGLPNSFPAGVLEGSNLFISRAEVWQKGTNTLVTLTLTEAAQKYTAEGGQLLEGESRPWMSLSFRERERD